MHGREGCGNKEPKASKKMVEKIRSYMEEHHMAEKGSRIVTGVSGGADSVCLLHVLALLSDRYEWKLAAVHVNHVIREEAGEDAAYVEECCRKLGIAFYLTETDVEREAQQKKLSVEEAGRQARYRAFAEAAADFGADRIAVAHNRNDRAETLLFHMFRGTGLDGMASIRPVRDNIIRPLLCVGRDEIESWLLEKKISWCIDKSNDTDTYTRNKIRRHILPFAREEICGEADVHLAQEAELLMQTADYVNRMAHEALKRCSSRGTAGGCEREADCGTEGVRKEHPEIRIEVDAFLREEELLRTHMLKQVLKELSGGGKDIGMSHIRDVEALFHKQGGRKLMLPYGIEALRGFGEVILQEKEKAPEKGSKTAPAFCRVIDRKLLEERITETEQEAPALQINAGDAGVLEFSVFFRENSQIIPQKTCTKWLDYDRIESLVLRTRQPGDYLAINDRLQKKRLKDYLIQEKIPVKNRENLLLLADGSHVLWVLGRRISSAVKVTEDTKRILRIHIRGGKENG